MKVIKKYFIKKDTPASQTVYITKNAEIVNVIDTEYAFSLIALCDSLETMADLRTFKVVDTNITIFEDNISYLGAQAAEGQNRCRSNGYGKGTAEPCRPHR